MPPHERLFQAAVITLLIISVGLIIAGAALSYQNGLGSGARVYQFGKLLLLGSGGFAIWYFKWSRGKAGASAPKLPKMTNGVYAVWFFVAVVIIVGHIFRRRRRPIPRTIAHGRSSSRLSRRSWRHRSPPIHRARRDEVGAQ